MVARIVVDARISSRLLPGNQTAHSPALNSRSGFQRVRRALGFIRFSRARPAETCSKHMSAATLATDQGIDDIGGATFQRCPHPWHRNHRRRLSGAAGRTRSAFVASHCGHGGIRRRSWGRTSLILEVTRSGSLCIAPLIRPTASGQRGIRRITQFAFGVQPVVNIVPILSTPVAVQVECALGDVALGQHWRDRCRGR
jgi:hypothetical protein